MCLNMAICTELRARYTSAAASRINLDKYFTYSNNMNSLYNGDNQMCTVLGLMAVQIWGKSAES